MTTLFISHSSKDKPWAERIRSRLCAQGYESLFLDSHPDDGIHAGAKWEQTLYQRLRQCRGVVVLCTAHWLASPWCVAEAIMARERGKRMFLLATPEVIDDRQVKGARDGAAAPQIPDFLKNRQFISLAGVTEEDAYARLWQGLAAEGLKDDFPLPKRPYPGLNSFKEKDAAVFFGRDDEIESVTDVLNKRRRNNAEGFILILGASGCGKSSLVRAGVLPRLKRASKDDGTREDWVVVPPFLGGKGLEGLAQSFAQAFKDAAGQPRRELDTVRGRLAAASDLRTLGSELLLAHSAPDGYVLLTLDQLEEVFGTSKVSEQSTMLRLLLDASADPASSVVVLATMRSDFLNIFQQFEGAAERYKAITLDPMPKARFSEIIEGPADRFGLNLDPGLSERLVEDTHYADALPLLAFTLEKLYKECGADNLLELKEYEKLFPEVQVREENGSMTTYRGVSAAIKHAADKILKDKQYAGLPAEDPGMLDLRRAFYRLARVGEEGQFTRRTARWSQMPESCKGVLQRFVSDRLLVSGTDNNTRELTLYVAHEALFRVWDTLHDWLSQDRKALALRAQIEDAAAEWDNKNRVESRTWTEERILDAVQQIGLSGVSLDDVARLDVVRAFLGPTDRDEIMTLPALTAAENGTAGSGRYGNAWRLPLSDEARASAGVRLALCGDTRRGVGLREDGLPDIDWCKVPGGEVTLEGNAGIFTVEPFYIAKYPVTYLQYRAFLKDPKGYHNPVWWQGLLVSQPPAEAGKQFNQYDNHPAENSAWVEVIPFCRWLSARLGYEVRLPTEWEWQQAATGGNPANVYPWGPDWDDGRAITYESGLQRSTAVGMYPQGASPGGVLDMSGNLWEWCLNKYDNPWDTDLGGEARRVVRGGSWLGPRTVARATSRDAYVPYPRNHVGWRVACSSPIL